jgi:hypothetical protein
VVPGEFAVLDFGQPDHLVHDEPPDDDDGDHNTQHDDIPAAAASIIFIVGLLSGHGFSGLPVAKKVR